MQRCRLRDRHPTSKSTSQNLPRWHFAKGCFYVLGMKLNFVYPAVATIMPTFASASTIAVITPNLSLSSLIAVVATNEQNYTSGNDFCGLFGQKRRKMILL